MPDRRTMILGLSATALAGCAPRAMIALVPGAEAVGNTRAVFVATTRDESATGAFESGRAGEARFGRYLVSVPPAHQAGAIETPNRNERPDPARHFVTAREDRFAGVAEFRAELARALGASGRREAVIYVHGFNNTFAEGVYRIAQIGHDLQVPGVALHYSWPSAAQPLAYAYDRDSALFARDGLERLLEEVQAAGARHVTLVAHSMGSLLSMETLRQIEIAGTGRARRLVQAVVLFSPDIDVELFRSQALRIGRLPDPFVIFTSRRDRALRLSARLTGQRARLGNLQDFEAVADLDVVVLDVSAFASGNALEHFAAAQSPSLLALFTAIGAVDAALGADPAGRAGLFPGTVLTLQNATAIILSPVTAAAQ
ncbi:MAG: alpha/beta hydrolase [Paracoccaceae bacterium]|nr:alpha/beta hydrolase [Paracoccaceae bacterium]